MDANHKKRLTELEAKGKLSKNEKSELKAIKKYEADCLKGTKAPAAKKVEGTKVKVVKAAPVEDTPEVVEPEVEKE